MKPKYFSQYDKPQSEFPYPSPENPKATGQTSGCGPTCFAMVNATIGNSQYTPIDAMKDAIALKDRVNGGTEDEFFAHTANKYKLPYSYTRDFKQALNALRGDKLVVCHMKDWFKPGAGHFILAWGVQDGKIQINDPASRTNTAKLWEQSIFLQKCIGYFIFSKPDMSIEEVVKFLSDHAKIDYQTWLDNAKSKKIPFLDLCFEKIVEAWKGGK